MPEEEDDLFRDAMHGVRRLRQETKVQAGQRKVHHDRQADRPKAMPSATRFHGPVKTSAPWVLKADGISQDRMRALASGRPAVDLELDLHGMTRDEAMDRLGVFVAEAVNRGLRLLCLVHGRGMHSRGGQAVLKEATYRWLAHGPLAGHVLAVIPKPGTGGGSCLVLLRRSRAGEHAGK